MERSISQISAILNGNLYRRNHLPNSLLTIKKYYKNGQLSYVKQAMMVG